VSRRARPFDRPDADGDGRSDRIDVCPFEPENEDVVRDDDGCPEGTRASTPEEGSRAPRPSATKRPDTHACRPSPSVATPTATILLTTKAMTKSKCPFQVEDGVRVTSSLHKPRVSKTPGFVNPTRATSIGTASIPVAEGNSDGTYGRLVVEVFRRG